MPDISHGSLMLHCEISFHMVCVVIARCGSRNFCQMPSARFLFEKAEVLLCFH